MSSGFSSVVFCSRVYLTQRAFSYPLMATPAAPNLEVKFQVRRSKGYEGMAASPDGSKLYALLEGALWDDGG